jgi:hypothetical protein
MTDLTITDIRKSGFSNDFDLITAIILGEENCGDHRPFSMSKKSQNGLLVLESTTADKELPTIGVRKGDQFIHMWAKPGHGLNIGEGIKLDDSL